MNKQEKTIAILLGLCLAAWLWYSVAEQKKAADAAREIQGSKAATQQVQDQPSRQERRNGASKTDDNVKAEEGKASKAAYLKPEKLVTLSNAQEVVVFSSRGASVKSVTLLDYAQRCGAVSKENPAVVLDFIVALVKKVRP